MHQINPVAQYLACRIVIFRTGIIHGQIQSQAAAHIQHYANHTCIQ